MLCLYYASQLYVERSVNIDDLALGIAELKCIFEELGAHVATDMNRLKMEIIETVDIHSNIVHFQNAQLEFTEVAAAQLAQEIDTRRLKAHALLSQIMAVAVPTLALQLYINPCMFWLARPAYLILAALQLQADQQKGTNDETTDLPSTYAAVVENLLQRVTLLDSIFKHEFIIESSRDMEVRIIEVMSLIQAVYININNFCLLFQEFNRILRLISEHDILKISSHNGQISINENECMKIILSSLAPFLCVYYQLTVTVNQVKAINFNFTYRDVLFYK